MLPNLEFIRAADNFLVKTKINNMQLADVLVMIHLGKIVDINTFMFTLSHTSNQILFSYSEI